MNCAGLFEPSVPKTFAFSTKTNDPLNAKFYIFQIQPNGSYKLVQ